MHIPWTALVSSGILHLMSITLCQAPMSSASPIVWALAELAIPYESIQIDLKEDAHKQPDFLRLNPMGQVPTLVDGGQAMFESSAILVHLGDCYGVERKLWPAIDSPERMTALTWVLWMAVTVGSSLRMIFSTDETWVGPELQHKTHNQRARQRFGELMHVLDGHLAGREYIASASFTLADVYCSASLAWATGVVGFDTDATPQLKAWLGRCLAREAAKSMG